MNKQNVFLDHFTFGIIFSFSWHFFWLGLFSPSIEKYFLQSGRSESVFLGAILKEADFSVNPNHSEKNFQSRKGQEKDFSRTSYFLKNTQDFNKPLTLSSEGAGIQKLETPSISQNFLPKPVKMLREASFGIGDFYNFIDQVDFSDVMPYFAKEDLIGFMDLDVFLANGGVVVAIRKITTCGDPSVDLIILRKLKKALFKEFFATDVWVRIRFKLK